MVLRLSAWMVARVYVYRSKTPKTLTATTTSTGLPSRGNSTWSKTVGNSDSKTTTRSLPLLSGTWLPKRHDLLLLLFYEWSFFFSFLKKKEGMDGGNLYLVPAARVFRLDWCLDFNRVGWCSLTFGTTSRNVFLAFFRIKDRKRTPLRFVAEIPPRMESCTCGKSKSPLAGGSYPFSVGWPCFLILLAFSLVPILVQASEAGDFVIKYTISPLLT